LRIKRLRLGPGTISEASSLHELARAHLGLGSTGEAERLARDALAIRREKRPPDHPEVAGTLMLLGLALLEQGRPADAVAARDEAISSRDANGQHPHYSAEALILLATALAGLGDQAGADGAVDRALEQFEVALESDPEPRRKQIQRLIQFCDGAEFSRGADALRGLLDDESA